MKDKKHYTLFRKVSYNYFRTVENISRYLANKTSLLYFDKLYCLAKYQRVLQKKLNLNQPRSFNEKIQWLKLYDRNPIYIQLADKYAVREYVKERIGEQYLNELIGVFSSVDEINFDQLPNQYALKANHGCGWNIICENKKTLDVVQVKNKLDDWLNMNFYEIKGEWQYKNIVPKIICERYLGDENKKVAFDYKFYCFHGEPKYINVVKNRFVDFREAYYNVDWELQPFHENHPIINEELQRPSNLELMIEIAKKLSYGIPFCRVDLYDYKSQAYFGEITLHHNSGFQIYIPSEADSHLGKLLTLPEILV